jgi:hypothetical protein
MFARGWQTWDPARSHEPFLRGKQFRVYDRRRGRTQRVEMIVLDADILIRTILGRRVQRVLDTYATRGTRFVAPDVAYHDLRAKALRDYSARA